MENTIQIKSTSGDVLYEHTCFENRVKYTMEEAVKRGISLEGADLSGEYLVYANLSGADLRGADLRRADLRGIDLSGADLRGADLSGADLREADMPNADLRGANLCESDLSGANLSGADLREADLNDADMSDADLREASVCSEIEEANTEDIVLNKKGGFRITVSCDPYNSRFHHHGEPVVRYDGRTPVEWIKEDDLTEQEALEELEKIASQVQTWMPYGKYEIEEFYNGEAPEWYKGEGYYENEVPMYLVGERYLEHDVLRYSIEEL